MASDDSAVEIDDSAMDIDEDVDTVPRSSKKKLVHKPLEQMQSSDESSNDDSNS
jgi:hypothetical protein